MISGPEFQSGTTVQNLVILLHGWGSSGSNFIYLAQQIGKSVLNTKFIAPNAHIKYGDNGYQWFELDDRSEDILWHKIQLASLKVNELIDVKLREFNLDERNLVLIGFSQGAMLSIHTALCRKRKIAGVVAYSGAVVAPSKLQEKILSKPSICVIHGTHDDVVPFVSMNNAVNFFKSNDIHIYANPIPGLNHAINNIGTKIGADFITRNLTNS